MVVRPPNRVAYASGINRREGEILVRRATSMTTGNIRAATPMLFINADSTAAVIMMTMIIAISRRPARRMTCRPIISAMPVRVSPSLRINIAHTVMTALLLKPANASLLETRPDTANAHRTSSATRSMRITSLTKRINEMARMPRTSAISNVINRVGLYCRGVLEENAVILYTTVIV